MQEQIIKLSDVNRITGLSNSSIYRLASQNKFPKPIKLSKRSSGWLKSEIEHWLEKRIEASRLASE